MYRFFPLLPALESVGQTFVGRERVTSPKSVCKGGYDSSGYGIYDIEYILISSTVH